MPTAGWPSAAAVATTSPMRAAPSSIENSVWRWRWTNDLANESPASPGVSTPCPQPVDESHRCSSSTLARSAAGRHEWDFHLGGGDRAVRADQLDLVGQGRIDEADGGARGEHD